QQVIYRGFKKLGPEVEQVMRHCSKVLSMVSKQIGIVLAPKFSTVVVKQLQFVRLTDRLILAILVGQSGVIQNRILEVEEDLSQETLDRFNRYLNDILEGVTISDIKSRIVEEMRQEKIQFDQMLSRALSLSHRVFEETDMEDQVFVEGQVNLLDNPEFADVEAMKTIFRTFEDKSILVGLLDHTIKASGVQIFIGSENDLTDLPACTLIASRYSRGTMPLGTLGVLGPTRLNYSKIIPVVDYTARLVSHFLESTL
ncbi:MAG: heat-inducible transcriptional repressor HrcA, partial [Deltaproteobacteria bacterium]|nr:heat-inducible transcriptional repressor HrcA [Deltaproteobacteria bacterium]